MALVSLFKDTTSPVYDQYIQNLGSLPYPGSTQYRQKLDFDLNQLIRVTAWLCSKRNVSYASCLLKNRMTCQGYGR